MSNHNYTKYSKQNDQLEETAIPEVEVEETAAVIENVEPEIQIMEETVETVTLPETVTGTVVNCGRLNVRVAPNATADIVCVLNVAAEVEINLAKSTDEWFSVCTATGVEGYCMRKFVDASL
jgi:SH3-like domain-containing protein